MARNSIRLAGGVLARFLAVGTFWKILLANALVVAVAVLLAPDALHALHPALSSLGVLAVVTPTTLLVNALVLRLALAPLTELERAAERVSGGDLTTRAVLSPLADRPLAQLTRTFNRMVANVEAQRELGRAVASRALSDAAEAKHRLSRDLRDETAQSLALLMIRLRAIKSATDASARDAAVDEVRAAMADVIEQLRDFSARLRPSGLDLLGVDQVIESYAAEAATRTGVPIRVTREPLRGALPPTAELELLRLTQDVIERAVARASSLVHVDIRRGPEGVIVAVCEDGATAPFAGPRDRGLFALRERASYFGGTIEVPESEPDATVRIRFPLNRAA